MRRADDDVLRSALVLAALDRIAAAVERIADVAELEIDVRVDDEEEAP